MSVAYSPDGRHIISGSADQTIRVWEPKTGAEIGNPLKGNTSLVRSVAYSPNGQDIISGSGDSTIRACDAEPGATAGKPLGEHTYLAQSIAYSSDRKNIVSGSYDNTTRVLDGSPCASIRPSSCNTMDPRFWAQPDKDGWVKDSEVGLLYWVPHGCRTGLHAPPVLMIPITSRNRSVCLDFDDFAFGTSWSQIYKSAPVKNWCWGT